MCRPLLHSDRRELILQSESHWRTILSRRDLGETVFEVGLALALFEAAFLGYQHRPPLRDQIDAFAQDVHNSLVPKDREFLGKRSGHGAPDCAANPSVSRGVTERADPPGYFDATAGEHEYKHSAANSWIAGCLS